MKKQRLNKILKALAGIDKKDWESFKSYVDYKMDTVGTIKNDKLTKETLKTFFLKIEN